MQYTLERTRNLLNGRQRVVPLGYVGYFNYTFNWNPPPPPPVISGITELKYFPARLLDIDRRNLGARWSYRKKKKKRRRNEIKRQKYFRTTFHLRPLCTRRLSNFPQSRPIVSWRGVIKSFEVPRREFFLKNRIGSRSSLTTNIIEPLILMRTLPSAFSIIDSWARRLNGVLRLPWCSNV